MKKLPVIFQWHFDLSIFLLALVIISLYYLIKGFRSKNSIWCFIPAMVLFLLIEFSPLDFLAMNYYFSAHMISHVVLLLICGPLIVLSIPSGQSAFLKSFSSWIARHNILCWFAGVGIMWFWHIPSIYNSSFTNMNTTFSVFPALHAASMLLAGMLFSWPLFNPYPEDRIHPLSGVIYLFTACVSCSLLGLLITFAPLNTYHQYLMNLTGNGPWGITALQDQEAAGLIMWVPCCFVYLSGCLFLLYRLFSNNANTQNAVPEKLNTLIP